MIWILPIVITLSIILWFVNGIRKIGAVSSGTPIKNRSRTALLMIDLQTVFWEKGPYNDDAKSVAMKTILAEVSRAKSNGVTVIAVRQEWSIPSTKAVAKLLMKGQAIARTPGTEIATQFEGLAEHVVVKRVQDSFETGELDKLLEELNVGKLRIVGLDTNFCLAKTGLAARQRGYEVVILKQGILTMDHHTAEKTLNKLAKKGIKLL